MKYSYELNNKIDSKVIDLNFESLSGSASSRVRGAGGDYLESWRPVHEPE